MGSVRCSPQPAAASEPPGRRLSLRAQGNAPSWVDSGVRSQRTDDTGVSVSKAFPIHDRYWIDFRMEAFNLFNWMRFAPPNDHADTTIFGPNTSTKCSPRAGDRRIAGPSFWEL